MQATLQTLKTFHSSSVSSSLLKALRLIRSLHVNQAEDLVSTIEANSFWSNIARFKDDSTALLSYLDKVKKLTQRRLDNGNFGLERDDDGLSISRSFTLLSIGDYQRLFLLNTPYLDLLSLDFCHAVFVDYERRRLLTYCEGDIVEKQADSLDQLILAVTNTVEWASQEYDRPMIHETSLALVEQAIRNVNEN